MQSLFKSKLFAIPLICLIVYFSGHAFQTIFTEFRYLIFIPALICLILMIFDKDCRNLAHRHNITLWVFLIMVASTLFVEMGSGLMFYAQLVAVILTAYLVVHIYSFDVMVKFYLRLMTVVSVIAVIGYFLLNFTSVMELLPSVKNINGVEYGIGIIFNYIKSIPERNCGMFWEPGLFATHLIIATVFELMTKEKANPFRLVLFTVSIFTANSSAGYVLWFLCIALFLIRKKSKKYGVLKSVFSVVIMAAALLVFLNFDAILANTPLGQNEYLLKLSTDAVEGSSRSWAIVHNLEVFITDPIFGVGYSSAMQNIDRYADTSTSTFLMSVFGVLGISFTVFIAYGIMRIKNVNLFAKFIILAIALIIVNKEPHHMILFTWIIIFYLMKGTEKIDSKINSQITEKVS